MIITCKGCGTEFEITGEFAFHHCPNDACQWVYWACGDWINSSYAPTPAGKVKAGSNVYIRGMEGPATVLDVARSRVKGKKYYIAIENFGHKNCSEHECLWVEQQ